MSPPIRLYNTLTRPTRREDYDELKPLSVHPITGKPVVKMYVCGPTVYDFAHIGNARPAIVFDVLFRLLRHLYGADHVTYVSNITDVDDKINARAFERWTRKRPLLAEMRELTESTNAQYRQDLDALNVLRPTHTPRATDFVANGEQPTDMVRIIARLIEKGVAYEAEKHVLFSPKEMDARFPHLKYGALSRRSLDDMLAGARVDVAPYKRDPMDFVLWKPSDPETEPGWDSPWGYGRPGWHIECSAMAGALLGDTFDIHAGGIDLVFPHHENEIAQTCCAFGVEKMASIWMHNGFLQVEGQKMSKSLGNFVTINELLTTDRFGGRSWPGEVLRLAMLKTHYRQPIDWTVRALEEAEATLKNWFFLLNNAEDVYGPIPGSARMPGSAVLEALGSDLNTWEAIVEVHASAKRLLTAEGAAEKLAAAGELAANLSLMGIKETKGASAALFDTAAVQALITARLEARRNKDFAASDRIRDQLAAMSIQLKDGKDADGNPVTTWEVKR